MTAGEEVVVLDLGCSDLVEQVEKVRRTVQHISIWSIRVVHIQDAKNCFFCTSGYYVLVNNELVS